MGFTNAAKRNEDTIMTECLNVVKFGEDMIEKIKETRVNLGLSDAFNMRIGIHFGSIIGGIIGTDIVRYDIYGDDVLIANKMESSGTKGRIQVSEAVKNLLEKDKQCIYGFSEKNIVE